MQSSVVHEKGRSSAVVTFETLDVAIGPVNGASARSICRGPRLPPSCEGEVPSIPMDRAGANWGIGISIQVDFFVFVRRIRRLQYHRLPVEARQRSKTFQMSPPKAKRRIVPVQITSPSKNTSSIAHALNAPINVGDLKEQAKKGRELGPARKIWVDLKPYQEERKQVSWKRLIEEQAANGAFAGVSEIRDASKTATTAGDADGPGGVAAEVGVGPSTLKLGQARSNRALGAYLNAITRAMNNVINSSDSDDGYDTMPIEDDGDGEDDGSDDENEREGGDVNAEVNLEENADGENNIDEGEKKDGVNGNGDNGAQQREGAKKKKTRRGRGNSYDYHDDWIDDSEFIQMVEYTDNRQGKHRGFVIYQGKIERDEGENEAGYEYDEEAGTRYRRRGNAKASRAPKTARAPNTSSTPGVKKSTKAKREAPPPYQMPDTVIEAIERVEVVAREVIGANGAAQNRKGGVPRRVREALLRGEPAFKPELDTFGIVAQRAIVDRLMESVGVFSSRQNINSYVNGRVGGALRQDLVFSADIVRDIVKELKPVTEKQDEKPVFESEDAYLKHIPLAVLSKVAKQIRLGLQGETLNSDRAASVLNEVLSCFPPETIELKSLMKLLPEVEACEKKMEEEAKKSKKRTKEAENGMKAVQAMGVQVNDLDVDMAVEKGVAQGADGSELRGLLNAAESDGDEYLSCALKLLSVAGPYGLKIKFIGTTGQTSELLKRGKDLHIRTVASKITKLFNDRSDIVAKLKNSKGYWALRVFPGIEFEESDGKRDGSSAPGPTAAKSGSMDTSVGGKRQRGDEEGEEEDDDEGNEDSEIEVDADDDVADDAEDDAKDDAEDDEEINEDNIEDAADEDAADEDSDEEMESDE